MRLYIFLLLTSISSSAGPRVEIRSNEVWLSGTDINRVKWRAVAGCASRLHSQGVIPGRGNSPSVLQIRHSHVRVTIRRIEYRLRGPAPRNRDPEETHDNHT